MENVETFTKDQLRMELEKTDHALTLRFLGKSILRNPGEFIAPLLVRFLDEAKKDQKRLVMDFRQLSYMNSSTLTPVIKILERARVGKGEITLMYRKALKWQDISFSALVIFQTPDGRIAIQGEV